jgi:hypothetical protein
MCVGDALLQWHERHLGAVSPAVAAMMQQAPAPAVTQPLWASGVHAAGAGMPTSAPHDVAAAEAELGAFVVVDDTNPDYDVVLELSPEWAAQFASTQRRRVNRCG